MRLWSDAGSVLVDKSGAGVRIENGKTFVRQGDGEWKAAESATDGIAPQGDVMAYLAAVKDVAAGAPETRAGSRSRATASRWMARPSPATSGISSNNRCARRANCQTRSASASRPTTAT